MYITFNIKKASTECQLSLPSSILTPNIYESLRSFGIAALNGMIKWAVTHHIETWRLSGINWTEVYGEKSAPVGSSETYKEKKHPLGYAKQKKSFIAYLKQISLKNEYVFHTAESLTVLSRLNSPLLYNIS